MRIKPNSVLVDVGTAIIAVFEDTFGHLIQIHGGRSLSRGWSGTQVPG